MTVLRLTSWTLLLAAGFALIHSPAAAQPDALPTFPFAAASAANTYKSAGRGGIREGDLKAARDSFDKLAAYYADVIKHPSIYKAAQEFKPEMGFDKPPTVDGLIQDLNRFFFEPIPGNTGLTKVGPDETVYIQELGKSFDKTLRPLMENHPEQIVRVNAARVFAFICRSGAAEHFKTVIELLRSPATPTQVKYYLLQAAANLLAAGDTQDIKSRSHAVDNKTLYDLVEVLMAGIADPTKLNSGIAKWDPATATPDQIAVARFVRRQAVKTLAQVRFAVIPGYAEGQGEKKGERKPDLYPVYLLARVALEDPKLALGPPPRDDDPPSVKRAYDAARGAECAEAVIGICNMAPYPPAPAKGPKYNGDVAVEVVTAALVTFAGPRAASAFDRSLPWKAYAARLAEALRNWGPLFDPDFSPAQPNKYDRSFIPPAVDTLFKDAVPNVLAPMDRPEGGTPVRIQVLVNKLDAIRAKNDRPTVLLANTATSIVFAPPK